MAGYTDGYGPYAPELWVFKLDLSGNVSWRKTTNGDDYAYSIKQTTDGGYIVAGVADIWGDDTDILVIKLDSIGNVTWKKTYGGMVMIMLIPSNRLQTVGMLWEEL